MAGRRDAEGERGALALAGLDRRPCPRGWWRRGARSTGRGRCRRSRGCGPGRPGRSARRSVRGRGPGCRCPGRARDARPPPSLRGPHLDDRPGSRVLDGVVEQVDDRRHELAPVAQHRYRRDGLGDARCRCRAGRRRRHPVGGLGGQRADRHHAPARTPSGSIRDRSSRSSMMPRHPLRLATMFCARRRMTSGSSSSSGSRPAGQGADRRAQLVADVGHEVAPHGLEP